MSSRDSPKNEHLRCHCGGRIVETISDAPYLLPRRHCDSCGTKWEPLPWEYYLGRVRVTSVREASE